MLIKMPGSYWRTVQTLLQYHRGCDTYASIDSGDGDKRAWVAVTAIDNIHLGATEVELGATVGAGDMKGNLAVASSD